jgi:N-acetylmuramic acid 6-phosphate etherase
MEMQAFLAVCDQFKLGDLVTEQPHPLTTGLARLAQTDLHKAIEAFHRVDCAAVQALRDRLAPLPQLVQALQRTLDRGGRIFLAGCGATGRLSLSLEAFAREAWLPGADRDRVIAFMAGGDAALIRSIEAFEDFPEYGARQLGDLGFTGKDLLLAITEGGETPFVIGACMAAAAVAEEPPWFFFCNPPETLARVAERARAVLDTPLVRKFHLETGPMALSGSTRLQASTVQMLVAGTALSEALGHEPAAALAAEFDHLVHQTAPQQLAPFIEAEANAYARGDRVLYQTDHYGMTVLTDTTERAPTFSIAPFENRDAPAEEASLCYLSLPDSATPGAAWERLLHRPPRTLEWPELEGRASLTRLLGYDISRQAASWRVERCPGCHQSPYRIHGPGPLLEFAGLSCGLGAARQPLLLRHLILKCRLNLQSTLVMGRLGRFESNLMTRVRPSNYKLVDRAARYLQHRHMQASGQRLSYREAVRAVFADL